MKALLTLLRRHLCANSGQCSVCGGVFDDWPGGTCDACIAIGRT